MSQPSDIRSFFGGYRPMSTLSGTKPLATKPVDKPKPKKQKENTTPDKDDDDKKNKSKQKEIQKETKSPYFNNTTNNTKTKIIEEKDSNNRSIQVIDMEDDEEDDQPLQSRKGKKQTSRKRNKIEDSDDDDDDDDGDQPGSPAKPKPAPVSSDDDFEMSDISPAKKTQVKDEKNVKKEEPKIKKDEGKKEVKNEKPPVKTEVKLEPKPAAAKPKAPITVAVDPSDFFAGTAAKPTAKSRSDDEDLARRLQAKEEEAAKKRKRDEDDALSLALAIRLAEQDQQEEELKPSPPKKAKTSSPAKLPPLPSTSTSKKSPTKNTTSTSKKPTKKKLDIVMEKTTPKKKKKNDNEDEDDEEYKTVKKSKKLKEEEKNASNKPTSTSAKGGDDGDDTSRFDAVAAPNVTKKKPFWAMKNRENKPPPMKGQKDVPEGAPMCLKGLTFVITGVLDSLERDEAKDLIMKYGGRVTGGISGKTSYLIAGTEAGESKTKAAKDKNVEVIDEDGLFNLISTRPEQDDTPASASKKGKKTTSKTPTKTTTTSPPAKITTPKAPISAPRAPISAPRAPIGSSPTSTSTSTSTFTSTSTSKPAPRSPPASEFDTPFTIPDSTTQRILSHNKQTAQHINDMLWVDRHRPLQMTELIGNPGGVKDIETYLRTWESKHLNDSKEAKKERAILIGGPPGTGKSTAAGLVARSQGYEVVEFNASDVRNKKSLESQIGELLNNRGLTEFFSSTSTHKPRKTVVIMDEVDGMSGNDDRGGIAQLIQFIKKTKVPIICICNDAGSQKIRSLKNYTKNITWRRPTVEQLTPRIMSIAQSEGLKIDSAAIRKIAESVHGDVRQILNFLQMWRKTTDTASFDDVKKSMETSFKDFDYGPFDVIQQFFHTVSSRDRYTWIDTRIDAYFVDTGLIPLFVQENYISARPSIPMGTPPLRREYLELEALSRAADSIALGDLVSAQQMREQDWGLAPAHGVLSCVAPGFYAGTMGRQEFPSWLGRNSTRRKNERLIRELTSILSLEISSDARHLSQEYLPIIRNQLLIPLLDKPGLNKNGWDAAEDGIPTVISLLNEYDLTRDDWQTIMELGDIFARHKSTEIDSKVKAAFTRKYNSTGHQLRVARDSGANYKATRTRGGGGGGGEDEEGEGLRDEMDEEGTIIIEEEDEEGEEGEGKEGDDIFKNDKMIKQSKPKKEPASKKGKAKEKTTSTKGKAAPKEKAKPKAKAKPKGKAKSMNDDDHDMDDW